MFVRKSTCDAVIRGRDYYCGLATERQDRILELAREGDRLQADLESTLSGKDWWRDNAEGCGERLSQVTAERDRLAAELRQQIAEVERLSTALVDEERASNLILVAERGHIAELEETITALRADNAHEHEMGRRVHQENNRLYHEVADLKVELARLRKINPATATVIRFPCRSSFPR